MLMQRILSHWVQLLYQPLHLCMCIASILVNNLDRVEISNGTTSPHGDSDIFLM